MLSLIHIVIAWDQYFLMLSYILPFHLKQRNTSIRLDSFGVSSCLTAHSYIMWESTHPSYSFYKQVFYTCYINTIKTVLNFYIKHANQCVFIKDMTGHTYLSFLSFLCNTPVEFLHLIAKWLMSTHTYIKFLIISTKCILISRLLVFFKCAL